MDDSDSTATGTASTGRRLVDAFGQAWERANALSLVALFAETAVFVESPFGSARTGTDAIRDYWQDLSYHQSEIRFRSGEIFTVGPWFATEFTVRFRRRRTGESVEARGAMFCEAEGGQFTEMRLYWHRRVGGREVLDR